ncbi:hypothetical protein N0V93_008908 [Gnomoniopsis smithogilvyi]|uniref:Uncharacterized protein n=1 Tax=Gnomoniopsis smithogilvyi TaxID=1191159 RepID=A0A9W8YM39_9PEZI|nr:hypothetical protein N0V93_008908 [Gnomoniopsis smithogilvyi]
MSATLNPDALDNKGEFHSRVPPAKPLTTKGHKPGVKVGNDALPEFSAKTYPPGTAPRENTFQPNPVSEVPGQALNPDATVRTDPLDFPGATSATVYNETKFGKPIHGQTSSELHGSKKRERNGVEGRVTRGYPGVESGYGSVEHKVRQVGADLEGRAAEMKGQRGYSGATEGGLNVPGAEAAIPVDPEHTAAELH